MGNYCSGAFDWIGDGCVDRLGSEPRRQPDDTTIATPCRLIAETPLASGSEPRRELVEKQIYEKHYNTNYTASWFLVRSSVLIDASGNLKPTTTGCGASAITDYPDFEHLKARGADRLDAIGQDKE